MTDNICEICENPFVLSCRRCYRRAETWGDEGAYELVQMAKRTDDICADEVMNFVDLYYIGKSTIRSAKAHTFRTAMRVLGYKGNFTGRIHRNGTSYRQIRARENQTARRHSLKKGNCEKCGATDGLHMHHITPLSWGGTSEPENIITLCESCHRKAHAELRRHLTRSVLIHYLGSHADEIKRLARLSISDNDKIK